MTEIEILSNQRPPIRHELGFTVDEQLLEYHPTYFNTVVNYIRKLGLETEQKGHSIELDEMKNKAYRLIGL